MDAKRPVVYLRDIKKRRNLTNDRKGRKIMGNRTVKEIVVQLFDWVGAPHVFESETGEHLSHVDYQRAILGDIHDLADLLGIDLSEVGNHEGDKEQNNN